MITDGDLMVIQTISRLYQKINVWDKGDYVQVSWAQQGDGTYPKHIASLNKRRENRIKKLLGSEFMEFYWGGGRCSVYFRHLPSSFKD